MQFKLLVSASLLGAAFALPGGSGGKYGGQRGKLVDANVRLLSTHPFHCEG
jgi:hypothetical protein